MSESQNKRRRGPAPKPEDQQRKNRISIFLTDQEYQHIKAKAGDYDLPVYVRTCAIDGQFAPKAATIPKLNIEVWKKLGRCTNNLNQLARHLNTFAPTDETTIDVDEVRQALAAFRVALLQGVQS
jgi:hypothetical protein